jgi:hypothetical protein
VLSTAFKGTPLEGLAAEIPTWKQHFGILNALALLGASVTLSYWVASPFQNARDNVQWRDAALLGLPLGMLVAAPTVAWAKKDAEQRAAYAKKFNRTLLDQLNLNVSDLEPDSQGKNYSLPEK